MLPRWLTALPRFAATWRDEIFVVALGLAYQAGVSGDFAAPRAHESEQVVVRIAAEQPRPAAIAETRVTAEVLAPAPVRHHSHAARAVKVVPVPAAAPVAHIAPMPRVRVVAPVHARPVVMLDAGENVAADLTAGLDVRGVVVDTFTLPEVRASIARARAAMDEARVRAAIQKALAAERAPQGPGA